MKTRKKKLTIDKYNLGFFVTSNQQAILGAGNFAGQAIGGDTGNILSGVASGVGTGAAIGGPVGALVGGGIGLIGGLIGNAKKKKAQAAQEKQIRDAQLDDYSIGFNSDIDTVNENPYGVYEEGGEVDPILPEINIELGEMQIDPESGKILRKYTGLNPETGGKYEPHKPGRKKDSKNNMVTAKEGSFIITKEKAKDYEKAIDNNDKLAQNSIIHNIRKKKRAEFKFANGSDVTRKDYAGVEGLTAPNVLPKAFSPVAPILPDYDLVGDRRDNLNLESTYSGSGFDVNNAIDYLPSLYNVFEGYQSPDYLDRGTTPVNTYRNRAVSNLPQEMSYTPLFNRMYRDRNTAFRNIDETTSSSAIARANKANVTGNVSRGVADAYFQGEGINNQIRSQRASMLNQLGEADRAALTGTRNYNLNVDTTNRQMDQARRQQRNYGLSQLQQMFQNSRRNKQLEERDSLLMDMLPDIYAGAAPYYDKWLSNYRRGS